MKLYVGFARLEGIILGGKESLKIGRKSGKGLGFELNNSIHRGYTMYDLKVWHLLS